MEFVGVVHNYTYHIPYNFGLFIFKNNCFIMVALNAMLNDLKQTASRQDKETTLFLFFFCTVYWEVRRRGSPFTKK